jgi:hypothetical protein
LSAERLDLEVHATHAATARMHAAACVLLRHFDHHGFGGDQERLSSERRARETLTPRKPPRTHVAKVIEKLRPTMQK